MTRIARFGAVTLSLVVLTTGGLLRTSHAEEPQGQVPSEEAPGQVQERGLPGPVSHLPTPPPPTTATATAWATWLNGYGPQAIPEETIVLGTFNGMTSPYPNRMVWKSDFPRKGISPACQHSPSQGGGGLVLISEDAPVVKINSFNERYKIFLGPNVSTADLRVVLTVPTLNGSEDYPGSLEQFNAPGLSGKGLTVPGLQKSGTLMSVAFHPRTFRPQILKFFNS